MFKKFLQELIFLFSEFFDFPKSKTLKQVDSKFLIFIPVYFFSFRISLLLRPFLCIFAGER
ncbi:MAG: hypothetical protein A3H98_00945 [Bacteroidetes bacterium RIFCSPLOWO2_02_FULL_36_8]|nr:MAG: hypothetical protein A3H98_00945 [Bacteroidetes bacterium RIFCSPLOWO2_02_FULL_36_8]OFY68909.1 MAG: hypothetical protein A3G23_03780 [Bacteroidetes bacterium RIFCSPLOWO2_12_FULL_37_12]